jgi:hypothetical protein
MTKKHQEAKIEGIQAKSEAAKTKLSDLKYQSIRFFLNRQSLIRV